MKISQLFPMGIKVKMDREAASKITMETPIAIYPYNSDKPIGVFHRASYLLPDGIMLKVNNYPVPPPVSLKKNGKDIPVSRASVSTPYKFYHGVKKTYLTVPMSSIYKDDKGSYVWRAVNQRETRIEGISPIVTIEKIRVVPGNLKMAVDANTNFRVLKDRGSLKEFDVILTHVNEKLRSGQQVCIWPSRYLFMPGDPVKVVIGK